MYYSRVSFKANFKIFFLKIGASLTAYTPAFITNLYFVSINEIQSPAPKIFGYSGC
jgi:hypothetical protein